MPGYRNKTKTSGVVLPLVMIFLAMLTVMAASTLQSGIVEFQMASNDRFREEAFQRAQGILSQVGTDINRFPVTVPAGIIACNFLIHDSSCIPQAITLPEPNAPASANGLQVFYEVERLTALQQRGPALREHQGLVSSSLAYDVALFETRVSVDGRAANLGTASLAQGVAVITASRSGQPAE